jgi:Snf7
MNCLYEAVAGAYVRARARVLPPAEDDLGDAEENLESCRASLAAREFDLGRQADKLARAAAEKKKQGDVSGAKFALVERKRVAARLEKIRGGIGLLDKQLDALRASELDKQLMDSLKKSSQAMRRAGIGQGLEEAESVMNELDDQMREASELTTVLATPLVNSVGGAEEDDIDVDEELGLIEKEQGLCAGSPAPLRSQSEALPASAPSAAPSAAPARAPPAAPARAPRVASQMDF